MNTREFSHILAAILIFTAVCGFTFVIMQDFFSLSQVFLFSIIIIMISVFSKKITASLLDADVEHEMWKMQWFGYSPIFKLKKPVPAGIIFPLFFSFFSLGLFKFSAFLTYETKALKHRAAKRFGYYSFTEMTDWHNALIGASSIISILLLAVIAYILPPNFELMAKMCAYYAFSNILPISKLDGTQIFFGSRTLWAFLIVISVLFLSYAILI